MKTLLLAALLAVPSIQPLAASTIGGDIAASFTFMVGSGFSIDFFGNGITIQAANIVNPTGGSEQALCVTDCEFAGWQHGNEGSTASIGNITSASFAFDLLESGNSGAFTGNLSLYTPFTTNVLAATSIETFLIGAGISNGLPAHVETDFAFAGNAGSVIPPGGGIPGGVPTPEPNSVILIAIGLVGLCFSKLVLQARSRAVILGKVDRVPGS